MGKNLILSNKIGHIINNFEDWKEAFIIVDNKTHWKEGRSAFELAKYFTHTTISESNGISMLREYLKSITNHEFNFTRGEIEHESKIDTFKGKGRIQDLILWGEVSDLKVVICIEAKVDEAFGDSISKAYEYAEDILKNKPKSNRKRRIGNLCSKYFPNDDIKTLDKIKYQLLHFLEGSIVEAKKIGGMVFMPVMAFYTDSYDNKIGYENKNDYEVFINELNFKPINSKNSNTSIYKKEIDGVSVYTCYIEINQNSQK